MFFEPVSLSDFIEMPSTRCEGSVLRDGVINLSIALEKNPLIVMDIIANHPFIPATFLLCDLAEKINKQAIDVQPNYVNNLKILYDICLERLVETCVYKIDDLKRCVGVLPTYLDKILQIIVANEHQMQRILTASHTQSPEELLSEIVEKYPDYTKQFTDYYNQSLNSQSKIMSDYNLT